MKRSLRSFTIGAAALLASFASAQYPYTIIVYGTMANCTPGDTVTIFALPDSAQSQMATATINANCSFFTTFNVPSSGSVNAFTFCGDGTITADTADYAANPFPDTTVVYLNLACGGSGTPCNADFTVQQAMNGSTPIPWQITTTNLSTGQGALNYSWGMPDGSESSDPAPTFTFTGPGVYGICLSIWNADSSCTDWHCDTVVVDSMGMISTAPVWYDCLGEVLGPNTPGTPCDDQNPMTANTVWTTDCQCVSPDSILDCLGTPGGSALPGTPCTVQGTMLQGTWSAACVCVPDTGTTTCQACITISQDAPFTAAFTSCSTVGTPPYGLTWENGNGAILNTTGSFTYQYSGPGNYMICLTVTDASGCTSSTCDTVVVDADGNINPQNTLPCAASFWTIQAYDSTAGGVIEPIPNEVWVWNLSSGGNGTYQFAWDFGDGSSSTEAFPTHVYDGPGPWLLCLTMTSGDPLNGGCTDSYCDSVSVDENGILNGMVIGGQGHVDPHSASNRSGGFTLNVIQQIPTGIAALPAFADLSVWPNPVGDVLNISFNNRAIGTVPVTVIDPSGRIVISENSSLTMGNNTLRVPTGGLDQGLYMVRIGNGAGSITQRFLKVR